MSMDSTSEKAGEEILKERKEKIFTVLKTKAVWIFYGILAIILAINYWIRTLPMPRLIDVTTGQATLGPDLDPFLFMRLAKYIVQHGSLMVTDTMRYFPLGFKTAEETQILPYSIAYFHKFLAMFSNVTVEYSAALFPAVVSLFMIIAVFLLVRRLFKEQGEKTSNIIALIAAAFVVVLPSLLSRTVAGIPEKENFFFALFFAFYFFIAAWQAKKVRNAVILGILAGISTGVLGLVWGGVIYAFTTIAVAVFIAFMLNKIRRNEILIYSSWFIFTLLMMFGLSNRYSLIGLATSPSSGISFILFFILIVDFILFQTKMRENKLILRILQVKLPERVISLIIAVILAILLISISSPSFVINFTGDILGHLTTPYTDRISFTVAENRQPFFAGEWRDSFGPVKFGIPLFFWLFFIGSIFLFNEMIKHIAGKKKLILIATYTIFLFALIFSKYNTGTLNGETFLSKVVYFGGMLVFIAGFLYVYYQYYKENNFEELKAVNFGYVLLFAYFVVSILAARSAVRLIMGLAPVASIIVAYFAINRIQAAIKSKEETIKVISWIIAVIVLLASFYTLYTYYNISVATAQNYVPDQYRQQWQKAMAWVRDNTPIDAVFSHWWDYGYWVQSMGERATVLDGGNAIGYWDYLMGREVLTGNESTALQFMYTHNSSYLLIDSSEIGKYGAYSSIGSDANYDRYSWISTFVKNNKATQEKRNITSYIYEGGTLLDEDYIYESSSGKIPFPGRRAGVAYLKFNLENGEVLQPSAIFFYQNQQIEIPLRYLYYNSTLIDFNSGYNGTLYLVPKLNPDATGQKFTIDNIGAAMFLSERNMRALWVRLYLIGEKKNFELVRNEPSELITLIKQQGFNIGDFVFYGGIQGPIKIWKANFPAGIKANPELLSKKYPSQDIVEAKIF